MSSFARVIADSDDEDGEFDLSAIMLLRPEPPVSRASPPPPPRPLPPSTSLSKPTTVMATPMAKAPIIDLTMPSQHHTHSDSGPDEQTHRTSSSSLSNSNSHPTATAATAAAATTTHVPPTDRTDSTDELFFQKIYNEHDEAGLRQFAIQNNCGAKTATMGQPSSSLYQNTPEDEDDGSPITLGQQKQTQMLEEQLQREIHGQEQQSRQQQQTPGEGEQGGRRHKKRRNYDTSFLTDPGHPSTSKHHGKNKKRISDVMNLTNVTTPGRAPASGTTTTTTTTTATASMGAKKRAARRNNTNNGGDDTAQEADNDPYRLPGSSLDSQRKQPVPASAAPLPSSFKKMLGPERRGIGLVPGPAPLAWPVSSVSRVSETPPGGQLQQRNRNNHDYDDDNVDMVVIPRTSSGGVGSATKGRSSSGKKKNRWSTTGMDLLRAAETPEGGGNGCSGRRNSRDMFYIEPVRLTRSQMEEYRDIDASPPSGEVGGHGGGIEEEEEAGEWRVEDMPMGGMGDMSSGVVSTLAYPTPSRGQVGSSAGGARAGYRNESPTRARAFAALPTDTDTAGQDEGLRLSQTLREQPQIQEVEGEGAEVRGQSARGGDVVADRLPQAATSTDMAAPARKSTIVLKSKERASQSSVSKTSKTHLSAGTSRTVRKGKGATAAAIAMEMPDTDEMDPISMMPGSSSDIITNPVTMTHETAYDPSSPPLPQAPQVTMPHDTPYDPASPAPPQALQALSPMSPRISRSALTTASRKRSYAERDEDFDELSAYSENHDAINANANIEQQSKRQRLARVFGDPEDDVLAHVPEPMEISTAPMYEPDLVARGDAAMAADIYDLPVDDMADRGTAAATVDFSALSSAAARATSSALTNTVDGAAAHIPQVSQAIPDTSSAPSAISIPSIPSTASVPTPKSKSKSQPKKKQPRGKKRKAGPSSSSGGTTASATTDASAGVEKSNKPARARKTELAALLEGIAPVEAKSSMGGDQDVAGGEEEEGKGQDKEEEDQEMGHGEEKHLEKEQDEDVVVVASGRRTARNIKKASVLAEKSVNSSISAIGEIEEGLGGGGSENKKVFKGKGGKKGKGKVQVVKDTTPEESTQETEKDAQALREEEETKQRKQEEEEEDAREKEAENAREEEDKKKAEEKKKAEDKKKTGGIPTTRSNYRVGLSRNANIRPLLKSLRK